MKIAAAFFLGIEIIGFFLPAFPQNFATRFTILGAYFCAHFFGFQKVYIKWKLAALNKKKVT